MAHVPHDAVVRRVEHIVQSHGQLNRAEVRAEMPACFGNAVEHESERNSSASAGNWWRGTARRSAGELMVCNKLGMCIQVFRFTTRSASAASVWVCVKPVLCKASSASRNNDCAYDFASSKPNNDT